MEQICKTLLKSHIHFIHSAVLQNYQFHKDASPSSNPFQFYLVRYSKNQYNKLTVQKKYFLKKFISIIQWWFYKFKNSILIGPKLTQLFDGAIKATQSTKFNYLINPTFSIIWLDTEKKTVFVVFYYYFSSLLPNNYQTKLGFNLCHIAVFYNTQFILFYVSIIIESEFYLLLYLMASCLIVPTVKNM